MKEDECYPIKGSLRTKCPAQEVMQNVRKCNRDPTKMTRVKDNMLYVLYGKGTGSEVI